MRAAIAAHLRLDMLPPSLVCAFPLVLRAPPTPPELVEVDRDDDGRPYEHLLPERVDPVDHEAVLQDCRNECADNGAEDRADAAEEARSPDHDGGDGVQIVSVV